MGFAPIYYSFFPDNQKSKNVWKVIEDLATDWNTTHKNQFIKSIVGNYNIVLDEGIKDEEFLVLEDLLTAKHKSDKICYHRNLLDRRTAREKESSDFIQIIGDGYPDDFLINEAQVYGSRTPCPACGNTVYRARPVIGTISIKERYLEKKIPPNTNHNPAGLDLINLPDGILLISKKVLTIFHEHGLKEFITHPVIAHETGKASEKLFLLQAERACLSADPRCTPSEEHAICTVCGGINGTLFNYFSVNAEWSDKSEIFSRDLFKYSKIFLSNTLYHRLNNEGVRGMLVAGGIDICRD